MQPVPSDTADQPNIATAKTLFASYRLNCHKPRIFEENIQRVEQSCQIVEFCALQSDAFFEAKFYCIAWCLIYQCDPKQRIWDEPMFERSREATTIMKAICGIINLSNFDVICFSNTGSTKTLLESRLGSGFWPLLAEMELNSVSLRLTSVMAMEGRNALYLERIAVTREAKDVDKRI